MPAYDRREKKEKEESKKKKWGEKEEAEGFFPIRIKFLKNRLFLFSFVIFLFFIFQEDEWRGKKIEGGDGRQKIMWKNETREGEKWRKMWSKIEAERER